jgi:cysteine synthase
MGTPVGIEGSGLGERSDLRRFVDIRQLIANPSNPTPLIRLNHVGPRAPSQLFLKLEWFNPFGSIKDRTALYLLKGLEARGVLAGKSLVEPSSGNTGIALAGLAAAAGLKLTVTIPDGVPEESKILLRMLGAEVWATPDDLCPIDHPKDGAIALAHSFVNGADTKDQYVMPNQYENPDNVAAHFENTGPEIWAQTEGRVDYFFAGYGTCGTLTGVGRYLKQRNPKVQIIAVEPQKGHKIPGLKNFQEAKKPTILDHTVIDHIIRVNDEPAYATTKRLFREEGLIIGPSTGAIVQAANQFLEDHAGIGIAISPDGGHKYASLFGAVIGDEGLPTV